MLIQKALIIDGSYLIHRALHVDSIFELHDSKGRPSGGILQVFRSLIPTLAKHPGYMPVFCWDKGLAKRRLQVYPNYKHHQDKTEVLAESYINPDLAAELEKDNEYVSSYHSQRDVVIEVLRVLGVPSLLVDGWEGDDLMYICSKQVPKSIIMTDDKDLIQLLSPTTKISRPLANEVIEYSRYQEDHNDPEMRKFVIMKAITGDGSDNIPKCCYGVGAVAALEIAETMLSDQNWVDTLRGHRLKKFRDFTNEESLNQFNINMELVDLSRVEITPEILRIVTNELNSVSVPNFFKVARIFGEYEINNVDTNKLVGTLTALNATLGSN